MTATRSADREKRDFSSLLVNLSTRHEDLTDPPVSPVPPVLLSFISIFRSESEPNMLSILHNYTIYIISNHFEYLISLSLPHTNNDAKVKVSCGHDVINWCCWDSKILMLWYSRMGSVSERLVKWTGHTGVF